MRFTRIVIATALVTLALPASASADRVVVNTTADELANGGKCSVREAIHLAEDGAANTGCTLVPATGANEVVLPANTTHYRLTRPRTGPNDGNTDGDLYSFAQLTIRGAGIGKTVLDGNHIDRVIHAASSATLELRDLTVTGGRAPVGADGGPPITVNNDSFGASGGFGGAGGGILNQGSLTLVRVAVVGNQAGAGGRGGAGGNGLPGTGSGSLPGGNSIGGGGGSGGQGGGIEDIGLGLTIEDSLIAGNVAGAGGRGGDAGTGGTGGPGPCGGAGGGTNNGVSANANGRGGEGGTGGGVYSVSGHFVLITGSKIVGNVAGAGGHGGSGGTGGASGTGSARGPGGPAHGGVGGPGGGGGGFYGRNGAVTIDQSTLAGNGAGSGGAGGSGGTGGSAGTGSGVCVNVGGPAVGGGGGLGGFGGGIFVNDGSLAVTSSTTSGNRAGDGGAGGGGGTGGPGKPGATPDSTGGEAGVGGSGGGLALSDLTGGIENATIAANRAGTGGAGGGGGTGPDTSQGGAGSEGGHAGGLIGAATLTHLTVALNLVGQGGARGGKGTGTSATFGAEGSTGTTGGLDQGQTTMRNTIVANNTAPNCNGLFSPSSSNNVSYPDSSCPASVNGKPKLSALGDNGGPTQTMTLGPGSAALGIATTFCAGVDQRGLSRPRGTGCDGGATERSAPGAATGGASAIKARSAKVTGSAIRHDLPASYRYEFGRTKAYGRSTAAKPVPVGGPPTGIAVSATLKQLASNAKYHYRLVVTNPDGVARGADRMFRTAAAVLGR